MKLLSLVKNGKRVDIPRENLDKTLAVLDSFKKGGPGSGRYPKGSGGSESREGAAGGIQNVTDEHVMDAAQFLASNTLVDGEPIRLTSLRHELIRRGHVKHSDDFDAVSKKIRGAINRAGWKIGRVNQ